MKYIQSKNIYLTSLLIVILLSISINPIFGQGCATNCSPNVQTSGWARGTTVQVYINPNITGDARSAIEQAFGNWDDARYDNNSNVHYEFTTTTPQSGVGNYLIVNYGTNLTDPQTGTQVRAVTTYNSDPTTGYTTRGGIRLDESMTNYDAVLEAMAHEIGHPMGLGHTGNGCSPANSVMTPVVQNPPGPATFNRTYGRATSPTGCDNQTLRGANYPPCSPPVNSNCNNWNSNTCLCNDYTGGGGGGGGDGGYNPGYPCTPYYWVYYESWDGGQTWQQVDSWYAGCW